MGRVTPGFLIANVGPFYHGYPGDLNTLQHQGGWKDPKTILTHSMQQRDDVHPQTVDVLFGKRDEVADDLAYG